MREKTCCFTGHRDLPTGLNRCKLSARLQDIIIEQIENGIRFFKAGGAIGFDTLAAQTVLNLKNICPDVKLILVLPCPEQAKRWSAGDVAIYERIKAQADEVIYTAERYFSGCMHKRNRCLVDNSSVCICYLTKEKGGTAYTVDYARKNDLEVINIAN